MNGFLVRDDGGLIAIDHIMYIQKEYTMNDEWNVKVYLTGEISVQWNEDPLTEDRAKAVLRSLQHLIQEAIKY